MVNRRPLDARLSIWGVGTRSDPRHPTQSFMSSTEMKRTFGFDELTAGDCDAAEGRRKKKEGRMRRVVRSRFSMYFR